MDINFIETAGSGVLSINGGDPIFLNETGTKIYKAFKANSKITSESIYETFLQEYDIKEEDKDEIIDSINCTLKTIKQAIGDPSDL